MVKFKKFTSTCNLTLLGLYLGNRGVDQGELRFCYRNEWALSRVFIVEISGKHPAVLSAVVPVLRSKRLLIPRSRYNAKDFLQTDSITQGHASHLQSPEIWLKCILRGETLNIQTQSRIGNGTIRRPSLFHAGWFSPSPNWISFADLYSSPFLIIDGINCFLYRTRVKGRISDSFGTEWPGGFI